MTETEFEKIIQKCKSQSFSGIPIKIALISELIKINPTEYYKVFAQNMTEFSNLMNLDLNLTNDQIIKKFKKFFVNSLYME